LQVEPCATPLGSVHWQGAPGLPLPTGPKRPDPVQQNVALGAGGLSRPAGGGSVGDGFGGMITVGDSGDGGGFGGTMMGGGCCDSLGV
jgi:hypothetical protein